MSTSAWHPPVTEPDPSLDRVPGTDRALSPCQAPGTGDTRQYSCGRGQALAELIHEVPDPELPHVTIGDLGIVRRVTVAGDTATVVLSPTYTGCPATEQIAEDVTAAARAAGYTARVETALSPAWTSDWITARGRARLAAAGIAPPGEIVSCPRCGSQLVRPISEFGSTACKALYACQACREPFERFKAI